MISNGKLWWTGEGTKVWPGGRRQRLFHEEGNELLMKKEIETIHSKTSIKIGTTLNMDNFESLRVDVGVELPCNVGEEAVSSEEAYSFAETVLINKVTELKKKFK